MPNIASHHFRFDGIELPPEDVIRKYGSPVPSLVLSYTCDRCGLRRKFRYRRDFKMPRVNILGKDDYLRTDPNDRCGMTLIAAKIWTEDDRRSN
jgi:hypothetical protein